MTGRGAEAGTFFDREARGYDAAHDRDDSAGRALRNRIDVVLRLLGSGPGRVLDCGMGPGRLLGELAQRGWSIAGIDVSAEMVALARGRLPEAADSLVEGGVEALPFPASSFDAAVATGVLEYVEDLARGLSEVARVLRPGGVFVISTPNTRAVRTLWRQQIVYPAARLVKSIVRPGRPAPLPRPGLTSAARLERLLAEAGLDVDHVEYLGFPAQRFEGAGGWTGRLLGSQLVVTARKTAGSETRLDGQRGRGLDLDPGARPG